MPKIIGLPKKNQASAHAYFKTGFYSLDRAFNPNGEDLGIPYGTMYELYGASHVGKSTAAYSLASMLAKHLNTGWVICDVEDAFTPEYLSTIGENQGMGENDVIAIASGQFHDDKLTDIFTKMKKENIGVGIIDSLGMLASRAEIEGELGEANMGKRAFLINQFIRKYFAYKNDLGIIPRHATLFAINHQQPLFSGYGMNRPGGTGKDYGAGVRIHLTREKVGTKTQFDDGSLLIKGVIKKLRWEGGGLNNEFHVVSKVNYGLHRGLSAMIDLKHLGLLKMSKGTIKLGKVELENKFSYYLSNYKDDSIYQPFYEALSEYSKSGNKPQPIEEENDSE